VTYWLFIAACVQTRSDPENKLVQLLSHTCCNIL